MAGIKRASLLFDIDNTLIDRNAAFGRYMQYFIARNLASFPDVDMGQSLHNIQLNILVLDACGRTDRPVFCQQILQAYPQLPYTEETLWADHLSLPDFVRPDRAVQEMLTRLSAEYQLMIISNGSASMQRRKLEQARLTQFFGHIFISAEVGYAKPDHNFFSHVLRHCSHAPIVMIGDDYINDMQPAMALGLKTVFINSVNPVNPINPIKASAPVRPDKELRSIHTLEEALACMI